MAPTAGSVAADGRLARGERTRRALAEALIALLEEGEPSPTARRIAERAGVSLRLVFHHFEDLESILRAAVAIQEQRHWQRIGPVEPTASPVERVRRLVRQRTEVFEAVAPVRRQAEQLVHRSPTVAGELARVRARLREQLRATFGPELGRFTPAHARTVLDALEVATSWEAWEQLQGLGRSPVACRRAMEHLAGAALGLTAVNGGGT